MVVLVLLYGSGRLEALPSMSAVVLLLPYFVTRRAPSDVPSSSPLRREEERARDARDVLSALLFFRGDSGEPLCFLRLSRRKSFSDFVRCTRFLRDVLGLVVLMLTSMEVSAVLIAISS